MKSKTKSFILWPDQHSERSFWTGFNRCLIVSILSVVFLGVVALYLLPRGSGKGELNLFNNIAYNLSHSSAYRKYSAYSVYDYWGLRFASLFVQAKEIGSFPETQLGIITLSKLDASGKKRHCGYRNSNFHISTSDRHLIRTFYGLRIFSVLCFAFSFFWVWLTAKEVFGNWADASFGAVFLYSTMPVMFPQTYYLSNFSLGVLLTNVALWMGIKAGKSDALKYWLLLFSGSGVSCLAMLASELGWIAFFAPLYALIRVRDFDFFRRGLSLLVVLLFFGLGIKAFGLGQLKANLVLLPKDSVDIWGLVFGLLSILIVALLIKIFRSFVFAEKAGRTAFVSLFFVCILSYCFIAGRYFVFQGQCQGSEVSKIPLGVDVFGRDINGDEREDLLVFRPLERKVYAFASSPLGFSRVFEKKVSEDYAQSLGSENVEKEVLQFSKVEQTYKGDFDADGIDELLKRKKGGVCLNVFSRQQENKNDSGTLLPRETVCVPRKELGDFFWVNRKVITLRRQDKDASVLLSFDKRSGLISLMSFKVIVSHGKRIIDGASIDNFDLGFLEAPLRTESFANSP